MTFRSCYFLKIQLGLAEMLPLLVLPYLPGLPLPLPHPLLEILPTSHLFSLLIYITYPLSLHHSLSQHIQLFRSDNPGKADSLNLPGELVNSTPFVPESLLLHHLQHLLDACIIHLAISVVYIHSHLVDVSRLICSYGFR